MSEMNTVVVGGYKLEVGYDHDADSPRTWDNFGTFITWEGRTNSPDKNEFRDVEEFDDWWKENGDGGVILPVYKYDHSDVAYSTTPFHDPWDSGQVGYIFALGVDIAEEYGAPGLEVDLDVVAKHLSNEVETYSQWASGEVYYYSIEALDICDSCREAHNSENTRYVSSCWGFIGGIIDEAIHFPKEMPEEDVKKMLELARSFGLVK
jgi:hypothetical protein